MERKLNRIGVFVCHCGLNIAASVDIDTVVEAIGKHPGVAHAENYMYMCSDPGQDTARKAIHEKDLEAVVIAACSPSLHERTFRNLSSREGLNPYRCEIANIREQCSWPHMRDKKKATQKAIMIIKTVVEKVKRNLALYPKSVPLTKRAMIVGAGVAGMQVALDVADSGYEVILVEREPTIGGRVAQLSSLFPTLEDPLDLAKPMMERVASHPRITLHTASVVKETDGYVGNFKVKVEKANPSVDPAKCDGCGKCWAVCPAEAPDTFERATSKRKAIYQAHESAVPPVSVIDRATCLHYNGGDCRACIEACPHDAIGFDEADTIIEEEVGIIAVATGFDMYPVANLSEYELDPDVIDALTFERLLVRAKKTGTLTRPSDGHPVKNVVFIQCSGSRDPEHHKPYCSRICCMYTAKQAAMLKKLVPDGHATIFYIDIRADGKNYEEFVQENIETTRPNYMRGRVSKLYREGDSIRIRGIDTLCSRAVETDADLVVLAMAVQPSRGAKELSRVLNIVSDAHGYFSEAHIKLRPVETLTAGIFLAGTAQAPRDIQDTIAQASASAAKVVSMFSRKELLHEPVVSYVDAEVCAGCGYCVKICPYGAIELDEARHVARTNEALCEGCGACAATCPSGSLTHKNNSAKQLFEMIDLATDDYGD